MEPVPAQPLRPTASTATPESLPKVRRFMLISFSWWYRQLPESVADARQRGALLCNDDIKPCQSDGQQERLNARRQPCLSRMRKKSPRWAVQFYCVPPTARSTTTLNGTLNEDLQQNWRVGGTLAFPVDVHNSVKLYASSGVSARTDNQYNLFGIAWQYRWGGGL
jgi:hypothetical protein